MKRILILGVICLIGLSLSHAIKGMPEPKFLGETIKLNDPIKTGGMPLYQVMNERKSQRDFRHGDTLSIEQLSQLLWVSYGPNRPNNYKTMASNKAKFGFDLYVFTADGTYKYLPDSTEMEVVNNRDYRGVTGLDPWVQNAAVNVCLIGVNERESYAGDINIIRRIFRLDSGHVAMNMLLYCAAEGLQCCPRANLQQNAILEVLGFKIDEYSAPLCVSVGP